MERSVERDRIIGDMAATFREAYDDYLKHHRIELSTPSKIGYWAVLEQVVRANPTPDQGIQDALIHYIDTEIERLISTETFIVDGLIEDASKIKAQRRAALSLVKPGEPYNGAVDATAMDEKELKAFEHKLQRPGNVLGQLDAYRRDV